MLLGSCGVIGATMSNTVLPVVTPPPAVPQLALWPPVATFPPPPLPPSCHACEIGRKAWGRGNGGGRGAGQPTWAVCGGVLPSRRWTRRASSDGLFGLVVRLVTHTWTSFSTSSQHWEDLAEL